MGATKQENGTWRARFYYNNLQGERIQKQKRGFKTKKEALEWEREFLLKSKFSTEMTFKSLYDLYIKDLENRLRLNTIGTKKYILELKILPFFQNMRIEDITPIKIREFQNILLNSKKRGSGKEYSQTYIKTINNQLVAVFNYAVKYHNLKENPCHKAGSIGKKNAEEMKIWTVEEFNSFVELLKNKPVSYIGFKILFWGGLRIGELLALTVKDVDLEKKTININKSYQRIKGADVVTEPKTPKSKRVIEITQELAEDLGEYIGKIYNVKPDTRLIHSTKHRFENDMRNYCIKAGVHKIRIHDLRHSHASLLIHLGVSPVLIARRLGHEKIQTTLDTYSHLYPSANSDMMDKMEGLKTDLKK